jgi:hypothetical protein
MKNHKKKVAQINRSQKWVLAVMSLSKEIGEPIDCRKRLRDELPYNNHRPLFYFGEQTMQIEIICDKHRGLCFSDLGDFRSDAGILVDFGPDRRCAIYGWIERERFAKEATKIDGEYCFPIDNTNEPSGLLDRAKNPTGSAPEISLIRYKDARQYSIEERAEYVLGGYRVRAYPAHVDSDGKPMHFTPWFLEGMDTRVLHMIRQDGHIYLMRVDGPIPDLSKLKPTPFRISDIIPVDDAIRQCAKNGHHFGPYFCMAC